ncbi:uncharacterized protein LOC131523319 isoform X2 [Onychostoma macrolepis]|uniref:uncharacterized protein LOC131523319 isoform X2 n=1 Tax=Onychostoma macrolepis TaxID=369639 RepID=UPI00272A7816|nr:uncharacterized protein LOC131523319 isoform X2 [Onychostoma macrolepis]
MEWLAAHLLFTCLLHPLLPGGSRASLGHISHHHLKDVYITQLVQRLESLHMSAVVNTQQVSLESISNGCMAQEPTTCCSQTKSSQVSKQHHTTQLRMLSHRWQRLGLQPPILWDTQEHISQHKPEVETRPELEIHPIQVSRIVSPRNEQPDEIKTISNSLCSRSSNERLEGNATEPSVSVESENSDLSDQEKDNKPILKWETAVELDLRPDLFDRDLEPTVTGEGEQVYPEVLPFPLKDLDFSQFQSTADDLESQHNLCLTDPCLTAMAARMIKLEKLQTATIQKEQGKAVRSRPATALVRNANHLRRMESPCSQEHLRIKGNNSVLEDVTKLALSSSSHSKSTHHNRPSPNAGKVWIGFQQPPALPKKPHSGVVKLKKTDALVQDLVVHSSISQKCSSPNSSKRCKPSKKAMPMSQKTSSEKTSVPAKALCRKT